MNLYGSSFNKIEKDALSILGLSNLDVDNYNKYTMKEVLSSNIKNIKKLTTGRFEVTLNKDDFSNATRCEIELFLNKTIMSYTDLLNSNKQSGIWKFVSLYYFYFFSATLFFRLRFRGFIFFDKNQRDNIVSAYSIFNKGESISFGLGDYYYKYKCTDDYGSVILTLEKKGDGVHKLTGKELRCLLCEMLSFCPSDDERVCINSACDLISLFDDEFASSLRNKINYTGEYSMKELSKQIKMEFVHSFEIDAEDFAKKLVTSTERLNQTDEDSHKIETIFILSELICRYTTKIYSKYLKVSANGFHDKRMNYFLENNLIRLLMVD